eukprot:1063600-Rhodomonas_salina.1
MRQRLALPQLARQPPDSLSPDLVRAQVQKSQRCAPSKHSSQTPRPIVAHLVRAQVKVRQRLALPQHPRQHTRSDHTDSVVAQTQKC